MHIELWDSWIRRTHRSHKPYGKDVDAKFKKRFEDAWKNAENKNWTAVCQEIADNTKDILEHTEQKQTYICCLAKKDSYLRDEKDQNDLRFYVGIKGAGWYLEWDINSEYLLIIKSTCQEDKDLIEETDQIKLKLQQVMVKEGGDAFAFKAYWIKHPTDDMSDEDDDD